MKMTIDQMLQQGVTVHKEGKLNEAENLYQKILETQPMHPYANHNLGILLLSKNKPEAALPLFKIAVEVNPNIELFWLSYINALINGNQLEEAEASTRKAIELKPEFSEAHYNLGNILKNFGRLEEAEASYKKAIELKPSFIGAYNNLGNMLKDLNRLEEAETSYKKAIKVNPDYAEAHNNMGAVLAKLDRLEEAEASYKKAIELKPSFVEAYLNLGSILDRLNRTEENEEVYIKIIGMKPNYADAYNKLGLVLVYLGRLEEAEVNFIKAIKINPKHMEAHQNLIASLHKLGKIEKAEVSCNEALAINSEWGPALLNRGVILFDKGEFEAALKDFDACNNEDSRARALSSLHRLGRVKEIYQRIETHSELDDENLRVAAFASFIAEKEGKETAHNFCKNPLDFIHYSNISSHVTNSNSFISGVIKELRNIETVWEPTGKSTHKGFQSTSNLFENPSEKINDLKSIVINEIDSYHLKFKDKDCSYIKKWPSKNNLRAWSVILKQQGYQTAHIHPGGWLSGVIYLKVVPHLGKNEGAIEFGLSGGNYFDTNSSTVTHQPKEGGVILFPSSLHHKTIPFTTDKDRIIVSFDLIPRNKNL